MHMNANEETLKALNDLLKNELSAIETYGQAMEKLGQELPARIDLQQCRESHIERAQHLRDAIHHLGGSPARSSGLWGAVAKLIQGGAKVLGANATIAALEEGEDYGLRRYQERLQRMDPTVSRMVRDELLPAQLRTHDTMKALKSTHSPR
jgi:uncharacterized protein (TIGR02284 family)